MAELENGSLVRETVDKSRPAALRRLPTSIENFDRLLNGGLIEGSSYIVQGEPGTGKTIMANQVAFGLAREGEKTLYLTLLSESFTQMFGFLQNVDFFDMSLVSTKIWYSSVYATVRDEGFDQLLRMIHRELRSQRPKLLVIDGIFVIDEIRSSASANHDFRRFLNDLTALTSQSQITLLLLTNSSRKPSSPEYTMVDGWIHLTDDAQGASARRQLIVRKHRGGPVLRGEHEYRITDEGLTVFPRLESLAPRVPNPKTIQGRRSTGVKSLDTMLRGGLPSDSATAAIGPTGSGKTTLGIHYLAASTPEEKGLFFGFYETPDRLCRRAANIGVDLQSLVDEGTVHMIWRPPYENIIDDLGQQIVDAVKRQGAKRVVIDGINALQRPLVNEPRLHGFLRALNQLIAALGATVLYTREVPQLFFPEALSADELSGLIDNTILLHYEVRDDEIGQRIGILKVRDSDFDHRSRPFEITATGMTIDLEVEEGLGNELTKSTAIVGSGPSGGSTL